MDIPWTICLFFIKHKSKTYYLVEENPDQSQKSLWKGPGMAPLEAGSEEEAKLKTRPTDGGDMTAQELRESLGTEEDIIPDPNIRIAVDQMEGTLQVI